MDHNHTRLVRCTFTTLAAVFFLGVAATPAAADQPTTVEEHVFRPAQVVGECAGHPITAEFDVLRRITMFYVDDTPCMDTFQAPSGTR